VKQGLVMCRIGEVSQCTVVRGIGKVAQGNMSQCHGLVT
jgi:hypothetical protein